MRTYQQTFAGAYTWKLNIPGRYFTLLSCAAAVNVRFYKGGQLLALGEINSVLAGIEVLDPTLPQGVPLFDYLEIDIAGADTVKIGIGNGQARNSAGAVTVSGTVPISMAGGAFTHTQASVTNADNTISAANAARRYLLVQNNSAAGVLRLTLDGAAATATKGVRIQPGGSYEVPSFCVTGAVRAFMETADATANNIEVVAG